MTMRSAERGFTLLEAMIALVVMMIGLLGLAGLQVVGVRANHFGKRMAEASALSVDLADQITNWSYADSRLVPLAPPVTSPTDPGILGTDLGRPQATAYTLEYSDLASDPNATNSGMLDTTCATAAKCYDGISSDVLHNGSPDYVRYWNVYQYSDSAGSNGLLVQIFVRWKEPSLGYRQIYIMTFKANPAGITGL
jgi:type II secretory pathway pseudopilin PulG